MKNIKWWIAFLSIVNIIYLLTALLVHGKLYQMIYSFTFSYNGAGALLCWIGLYRWNQKSKDQFALKELLFIAIADWMFYLILIFLTDSMPKIVCVMVSCINLLVFITCYRKIDFFVKDR